MGEVEKKVLMDESKNDININVVLRLSRSTHDSHFV